MIIAVILSAVAMTMIVGVRYLLTSGGFALATRWRHPGLYRGLDRQIDEHEHGKTLEQEPAKL